MSDFLYNSWLAISSTWPILLAGIIIISTMLFSSGGTKRSNIMATKKEKHEAAMARREVFLAEQKKNGLDAQRLDRQYREIKAEKIKKITDKANRQNEDLIQEKDV